ncbi:holliday junction resolvase YEN1 [Microdochium nivale]|nr:holliday junction resolvase YEN1 [Microdochium nivale]
MGIKGIYKEIGQGQRVSLAKLAITKLEQEGRPLRIAIDISIWQFQAQAARGGVNPAIRTLFYRLLRLLSLSIQPIFVFDGPNKPAFKRNKRSGRGDGLSTAMAKRLLKLFGCLFHDAPGEAEAECALLQRQGIVDAVLSEDVDTIMFGCTRTLRNWSAEGTKGSKTPTHITMYDTTEIRKVAPGLDREGMVLVALMSGGDYIPEGIPGAGIKLACEAAKAGFGTALCKLKRADTSALASWKEWMVYELRTNESGFFRTKHKALSIPEDFPSFDILRYYTHPVVSPQSVLDTIQGRKWQSPVNIPGLREFARETFDWDYRAGAIKFIRVLAPVLLVQKLMERNSKQGERSTDVDTLEVEEKELVKAISSRRSHFSTDATPELRVSYIPTDLVGHSFEEEPEEVIESARDTLALNSDDEFDAEEGDMEANVATGSKKAFCPTEPDLIWLPETIAKLGVPITVEDWEEAQRAKISRKTQKSKSTAPKAKKTQPVAGAISSLDTFVRVTKVLPAGVDVSKELPVAARNSQSSMLESLTTHTHDLSSLSGARLSDPAVPPNTRKPAQRNRDGRASKQGKLDDTRSASTTRQKLDSTTNPWTIAGSQVSPRKTRTTGYTDAILINSSPPESPSTRSPASGRNLQTDTTTYDKSARTEAVSNTSPHKRRSVTPPSELQRTVNGIHDTAQRLSPTPQARSTRKLARTESMPVAPSPQHLSKVVSPPRARGGLTRAHTVAADVVELEDSDDDNLPPISALIGSIPKNIVPVAEIAGTAPSPRRTLFPVPTTTKTTKKTVATSTSTQMKMTSFASTSKPGLSTAHTLASGKPAAAPIQATAGHGSSGGGDDDAFGSRMTKMYVPSQRDPGFYKEVAVTVDEAEAFKQGRVALGAHAQRRDKAWRRSDVSCIDLTGEP